MPKRLLVRTYNLADMSFEDAMTLAFDTASESERVRTGHPLTYEKLAIRCGKATSTMHRYFTDPEYNPPTHFLPTLCKGLGNTILTDWLAIHCGGIFVPRPKAAATCASVTGAVDGVNKETSDVIAESLRALADGNLSVEDYKALSREMRELLQKAHGALMMMEQQMDKAERGQA